MLLKKIKKKVEDSIGHFFPFCQKGYEVYLLSNLVAQATFIISSYPQRNSNLVKSGFYIN